MSLRLAFVLLICGCGPERDPERYVCTINGVAHVGSPVELNCAAVQRNVDLAYGVLGPLVTEEEALKVITRSRLFIHPDPCINGTQDAERSNGCHAGQSYVGKSEEIDLGGTMFTLAHEYLHRLDVIRQPVWTPLKSCLDGHMGWPLEWYEAEDTYRAGCDHAVRIKPKPGP